MRTSPAEIRKIGEQYESANFETPSMTVSVTEALNHTVSEIVNFYTYKTNADRLIVLIDDLDRCEADMAQKLLEGLKRFLNLDKVVFVIAMDETVVEEYIAKSLFGINGSIDQQKADLTSRRARQYLEKLCQSVYRLPFASQPEDVFLSMLEESGVDQTYLSALKVRFGSSAVVPPNPRRIRHLSEITSRLMSRISLPAGHPDIPNQVTLAYIVAYLHQFEPAAYRLLQRHRESFFYDYLKPVCSGAKPSVDAEGISLVVPRSLSTTSTPYQDPIRSGVFYPATLFADLSVLATDLDVFLK